MHRLAYRVFGVLAAGGLLFAAPAASSGQLHTSLVAVTDTQQVVCLVSNVGKKSLEVSGEIITGAVPPVTLNSTVLSLDPGESEGIGISTPAFGTMVRCSLSFKGRASRIRAVLRSFEAADLLNTVERAEAR
jgi:hypothetical protein